MCTLTKYKFCFSSAGFAKGNNDIELQCFGEIEILEVEYFGITSTKESKDKVSEFCKNNLQRSFNQVRCVVSVQRVFDAPYDDRSYTQISYLCKLPSSA